MQILAALAFSLTAFALDPASLPDSFREAAGKTFAHPGPNCFATALKLTGITTSFRGMDEPEFREITRTFCERTDSPAIGDIGVYEKPGYAFVHAYAYLTPEWSMEKPGVDYMGKTPIALAATENIEYRYLASPECRRYSKNISECSNAHYFLRCRPVLLENLPGIARHQSRVKKVEDALDRLLDRATVDAADAPLFFSLEKDVQSLERELGAIPEGKHSAFLKARIVSLKKQLEFMRPKYR